MKIAGKIVGWVMMVLGAIWVLQGLNVLPGSFMTGQTKWAIYGSLLFAAGFGLVVLCRAGRTPTRTDPGGEPSQP